MSIAAISSLASRFGSIVGSTWVKTDPETLTSYAVDAVQPKFVIHPESAEQTAEVIQIALESRLSVIACGSRTTLGLGRTPTAFDLALDMRRVTGIAHYDPGDLTISVNAGMSLKELGQQLEQHNQFLPLTIPFYEQSTVGGAVAGGLDSPLRHGYGTARDFLIGAEFVDGTGALAKSGGRVVKNVTGYDFHKLLHGSLGSLAVITRLNFRTFPRPPARRGFLASFADEKAAFEFGETVSASQLQPVLLELLSPEFVKLFLEERSPVASLRLDTRAWTFCIGFEGSTEVCERYARDLSVLAREAGAQNAVGVHDAQFLALLDILRDAPGSLSQAAPEALVFRFATVPAQVMPLLQAVRSFAISSWLHNVSLIRSGSIIYLALLPQSHAEDDGLLKQLSYFWKSVGSLRGKLDFNASLLFYPARWKSVLDPWAHASLDMDLHRKVKRAFDPHGIFSPGRFVGGI